MTPKEAVAVLKAGFRVADLEPETVRLYISILAETQPMLEHIVQVALDRCKFFPTIAELREIALELSPSRHLGPEEAWALVASLDESESVVWTDEIATAYGLARKVLPDRIGARMAFLAAYKRELAKASPDPRWWASLGEDVAGRAAVLADAVERGRLPSHAARALLPPSYWLSEFKPLVLGESRP